LRASVLGHNGGEKLVPFEILDEVIAAIRDCPHAPARGKTGVVRRTILKSLSTCGWSGEIDVDRASAIAITSAKRRVGLCFQTGNMSRIYADLLKLQVLHYRRILDSAIMVVPSRQAARAFGSNIANADRLARELSIFEGVISVPIAVIGLDG
jgi:hypothetical protein